MPYEYIGKVAVAMSAFLFVALALGALIAVVEGLRDRRRIARGRTSELDAFAARVRSRNEPPRRSEDVAA